MKTIKYIIFKEGSYYVSQSLNVDVSSFDDTIESAKKNLKEALDLYFEDDPARKNYRKINETLLGELSINI
jgi:predicted RNase H-like HicB family nuclease